MATRRGRVILGPMNQKRIQGMLRAMLLLALLAAVLLIAVLPRARPAQQPAPSLATATGPAAGAGNPTPDGDLPLKRPQTLSYAIDRSALPPLPYLDLTLLIHVDVVDGLEILGDGEPVAHQYDPQTGTLLVTTTAARLDITLDGPAGGADVGAFAIAPLKDNKQWAWSHGFDDNVNLRPAIELFRQRGWRATLFLIVGQIADDRDEDWIADAPLLVELLDAGWSLGNHTWSHACLEPDADASQVLRADARLREIVARSTRSDYPLISFAAPCFGSAYDAVFAGLQASGATQLLFNETRNDYYVNVAPGAQTFMAGERNVVAFTEAMSIGRNPAIDLGLEETLAEFDWLAGQAAEGHHLWFNTLAHGEREMVLRPLLDHLYASYGPAGSDELWVAPSDEIYSYLLVRDHAVVERVP